MTFRAVLLTQEDRTVSSEIAELDDSQLPEGNVTVDVSYSTLNYKDGMILTGVGRLVRDYPHVPGIDFSGIVSASADPRYAEGDRELHPPHRAHGSARLRHAGCDHC